MRRTFLVATLVVAALPALAVAQSLDEIIERHIAARGGAERLKALGSLRMTGRVVAGPAREALVSREILRPGRIRTEFTFQGFTDVYVYDGQRGWYVSPSTGVFDAQPMTPENVLSAAEQADIEGPLVGWRAKGHKVELVGKDTVDGRDAYRVAVTLASGGVREDYIDARTFQVVRTSARRYLRGQTIQVETTFGNYQETGGLWFPHSIVSTARGRPQALEIVVDTVEVNPPIDEKRFQQVGRP